MDSERDQNNFKQLAAALQARRELAVFSVNLLLDGLRNNDAQAIAVALRSLGVGEEDALMLRTTALNSALHQLVEDFRESLEITSHGGLPRAANRLREVIEMSFQAADKTLFICESHAQLLKEQRNDLALLEQKIPTLSENDAKDVAAIVASIQERTNKMQRSNHEIVMAQSFQDLSGQAVNNVIELIKTIEQQLISLTNACSDEDEIEGIGVMIRQSKPASCDQQAVDVLMGSK